MSVKLQKKPRTSKHSMSNYLKSCKRIARFKQSRMFFVADGCYGNVVPVHKEIGVIMTIPEMDRIHKCRKHAEWKTSIKITVKRVRVKEVGMETPVEQERDFDQEYKEWAEEVFWSRM